MILQGFIFTDDYIYFMDMAHKQPFSVLMYSKVCKSLNESPKPSSEACFVIKRS